MKKIFEETSIGNLKMKNRIFRGALWEDLADEKGHLTPELENIYVELAKGGAGAIITGYAFVTEDEQPNPGMMGIYSDDFIDEYKKFTDKIHSYNSKIIMQIVYGGFMTNYKVGERVIFGPSTMQNEVTGTWAKEMTKEEIKKLIKDYGKAALRVKKSGFDGIEIHCGHGYLLSQFLSPYYNKREDEYGGSIENRARIIFEVYKEMRACVGKEFPIFIKLNSADYVEGGYSEEEAVFVSKKLAEMGIDAIEVTGGNESIKSVRENNLGAARTKVAVSRENQSYFRKIAAKIAKEIDKPVILIGGNREKEILENILNETEIEYFSMSRPLTCEPDLVKKWEMGETVKAKCISCNRCYTTPGKRCIFNLKK